VSLGALFLLGGFLAVARCGNGTSRRDSILRFRLSPSHPILRLNFCRNIVRLDSEGLASADTPLVDKEYGWEGCVSMFDIQVDGFSVVGNIFWIACKVNEYEFLLLIGDK